MCNGLDVISSGSVSTGTGFRSVAKPDLVGAVSWFGVEKMGDQKTYFVVMQDNFNALYRRHLVTISPLFLHIKN